MAPIDPHGSDRGAQSELGQSNRSPRLCQEVQPVAIDPVGIDQFTRLMRQQLVSGDVAARKDYRASVADAVIVSEDKIQIVGSNDKIRSTYGSKGQPTPRVRKFVQKWRVIQNKSTNTYVVEIAI